MERHYTYMLIDVETNEFYIGVRTCRVDILKDKYMGSMVTWKVDKTKLIKKILREFNTREEANLNEIELIKLFVRDPLNRNYHIPTIGFCGYGLEPVNKSNREEFIEKAINIHSDLYDYSKVVYLTGKDKVIIGCKKHGDFLIKPEKHLIGQGCNLCGYERASSKQRSNTDAFIEKAINIHSDLYDYSKVDYKGRRDKVIITCKKHGDWEQEVRQHLKGQGCKKCAGEKSGYNKEVKGFTVTKRKRPYRATIAINGKNKLLGDFSTEEEAREAYLKAKEIYHKID